MPKMDRDAKLLGWEIEDLRKYHTQVLLSKGTFYVHITMKYLCKMFILFYTVKIVYISVFKTVPHPIFFVTHLRRIHTYHAVPMPFPCHVKT
jgi:hypothetical protein